ncbi:helix-turn-helix transcriptional regulator [Candidatus Peregrinibacteria bacterium]|nr:MAG: helix-turn-helix transcriptional regulator [Candidatus Peregrinibacteria bacterium]
MKSLKDPRYRKVVQELKTARLSRNYTQEEVAKLIKKPQSFLSKIENFERRIDIIELYELMKVYDLKWNELTRGF